MGKRKWKAGRSEQAQEVSFLRRFRMPIAVAAVLVVAIAFFIYRFNTSRYQYGDARSDYNRALADCLQDRTRVASSGDAVEEAADACVRDTPGPASNEAH
jgi:Flp pilus assembly protein TadB